MAQFENKNDRLIRSGIQKVVHENNKKGVKKSEIIIIDLQAHKNYNALIVNISQESRRCLLFSYE